jgi:hypothetical protein
MGEGDRKRLVISEDDLAAPASPTQHSQGAEAPSTQIDPPAPSLPTVRGVGAPARRVSVGSSGQPTTTPSGVVTFARSVQGRNLVAAACGITLGWAVCQITGFGLWTPTSKLGADATSAAWTGALGFFFAVVYAGWEQILARSSEGVVLALRRAGPLGFALAFAAGFLAQIVYTHFYIQILKSLTLSGALHLDSNVKLYLARSLAWGMFGLGMGVAVAGGVRARMVNGVVGGALGGALGGLVFQWVGFKVQSNAEAQLIGLLVVGGGIGLAISLVERARRDAWLNISGGPMAGKEFIIYGSDCTLGASPKCDITLIKDPTVQGFHAVVRTTDEAAGARRVLDAYQGCAVTVNGAPVAHHRLRSGDVIGIGATAITYSERAAA